MYILCTAVNRPTQLYKMCKQLLVHTCHAWPLLHSLYNQQNNEEIIYYIQYACNQLPLKCFRMLVQQYTMKMVTAPVHVVQKWDKVRLKFMYIHNIHTYLYVCMYMYLCMFIQYLLICQYTQFILHHNHTCINACVHNYNVPKVKDACTGSRVTHAPVFQQKFLLLRYCTSACPSLQNYSMTLKLSLTVSIPLHQNSQTNLHVSQLLIRNYKCQVSAVLFFYGTWM